MLVQSLLTFRSLYRVFGSNSTIQKFSPKLAITVLSYTEDPFGSGSEQLPEVTGKDWCKTSAVPQL